MANRIKSGIKRHRQSLKRRDRNTAVKSDLKTQLKKFGATVAEGDAAAVDNVLRETESKLKKAATKGVMHKKTASRRTSRLAKKVSRERAAKVPATETPAS
ncbi:MAG: 30S ribosomal protein S20 [Candidatus Dadabacteria bacterium]|nr:30S ribosomal protein S20 [Candidatus Dadabacteria bacterium]